MKVVEHDLQPNNELTKITVSVGYYNWWSVGIEVREDDELIYASNPNKDIHFAEKKLEKLNLSTDSTDDLEKIKSKKINSKKINGKKTNILYSPILALDQHSLL
jgi:hypothetical protein